MKSNYQQLIQADVAFWTRGISDAEAAEFLGIKLKRLQYLRYQGQGPAPMRNGERAIRYRRIDLLAWQESDRDSSVATRSAAVAT